MFHCRWVIDRLDSWIFSDEMIENISWLIMIYLLESKNYELLTFITVIISYDAWIRG